MLYELEFTVGNVKCVLINTQPDNTPTQRLGKYYEHYHSCFEIHYVVSGEAKYLCGKNSLTLSERELMIIPPRMYHKEISQKNGTSKMTVTLDIFPPKSQALADINFYNTFRRDEATVLVIKNRALAEELLQIKEISKNKNEDYSAREKLRALAHLFTVDLYSELSSISPRDDKIKEDSTLSREYAIDTFLALNFMSNSARDDLAEMLHLSPRQLNRIIKKSYGKSYREKLTEIRLEIALGFLKNTDKSITDISEELGYSSEASFSAFIKRTTGKSPREIRKNK